MSTKHHHASRLFVASALVSALLAVLLIALFFHYDSKLALAQSADSIADTMTGIALLWALALSAKPADDGHPFGHDSAQPIAALIVAVLACVLAIEVARDAVTALVTDSAARLDWNIALLLGAKVVIKAVLATAAAGRGAVASASALKAFQVDARNDVLVGAASIAGFAAAKWLDMPSLDAWLALPISAWVAFSGASLAMESATVLMGAAAPAARTAELTDLAAQVPGVRRVEQLKARSSGENIHVWLEVHVDPLLTVRAAHDIGEAVERTMLQEPDVYSAVVHVDADEGGAH